MTNYFQQLYEQEAKQPQQPKQKKRRPGCLIFFIVIIFLCGAGYVFLTLKPSEDRQAKDLSGQRIYGELSAGQEFAFNQLSDQSSRSLELQEQAGSIRALMLDVDMGYPEDPERQVKAFMEVYQSLYLINDFENEFRLIERQNTDDENVVLKYSQWIESFPVYSSQLLIVLDKSGSIKLVSGGYLTEEHLWFDPEFTYDKTEVIEILYDQGYSIDSDEANIELVLFNDTVLGHVEGETELAWTMDIYSQNELFHAVVSGKTGEFLILAPNIIYYNYELFDFNDEFLEALGDETEENCKNPFISLELIYANNQKNRVDVDHQINYLIDIINKTLSVYENHLGWKGSDNNDSTFAVLINVNRHSPFHVNFCGNSLIGFNGDDSLITAENWFPHEFQHAVTDVRVSGLLNSAATAEAGALDEAYSDIFTALVDTKNPWQLYLGNKLIRDMRDPKNVPNQVDHYKNFLNPRKEIHFSHQNSTIISHAAYLIAEGGRKNGIQVEGIGSGDMTKIFFNSQDYLPYNSTFFLARWAVLQACEDHYQDHEIKKCDNVRNAFAIVGIGDPTPQPRLMDQLSETIGSLQEEIVNARVKLVDALFEKIQDMGIQVDDFLTRMETDLINLLMELVIKLLTSYIQTFLKLIFDYICTSLVFALVIPGTTILVVKKRSIKI